MEDPRTCLFGRPRMATLLPHTGPALRGAVPGHHRGRLGRLRDTLLQCRARGQDAQASVCECSAPAVCLAWHGG